MTDISVILMGGTTNFSSQERGDVTERLAVNAVYLITKLLKEKALKPEMFDKKFLGEVLDGSQDAGSIRSCQDILAQWINEALAVWWMASGKYASFQKLQNFIGAIDKRGDFFKTDEWLVIQGLVSELECRFEENIRMEMMGGNAQRNGLNAISV